MIILFFRCSWRTTVSPNAFGTQRKPQSRGQTAAHPNGFGAQEVEGELPQILEYLDYLKDAKICLMCMISAEAEMFQQLLKVISYPVQGEIRMVDLNLDLYD